MLNLILGVAMVLFWGGGGVLLLRSLRRKNLHDYTKNLAHESKIFAHSDKALREMMEAHPRVAVVAVRHAYWAHDRQLWEEAALRWAMVRKRFPREVAGFEAGSNALVALGRDAEVEAVLSLGVRRIPDNIHLLVLHARSAIRLGNTVDALRRYERARRRVPGHPYGFTEAADLLIKLGRSDEAEAILARGLAGVAPIADCAIMLANMAAVRGDLSLAEMRWADVRRRFPSHSAGYTAAGDVLRALGRPEEADDLLDTGLAQCRPPTEIYRKLRQLARERHDWPDAIRCCRRVLEFPDAQVRDWMALANAQMDSGDFEEARKTVVLAMDRHPDLPDLADLKARLEERQRAAAA
jgi:predicted Zn-dependent protease